MEEFKDILHLPVFVGSMSSKSERWSLMKKRLDDAGFMNYQMWKFPDGRITQEVNDAWDYLNLDVPLQRFHFSWGGTLAGTIGYIGILKHAIDRKIPHFVVFEDDIQFHPNFTEVGSWLYELTKQHYPDWDLIYLGCQPEYKPWADITVGQVYGGYSLLYTLDGAKKVYDKLVEHIHKGDLNCFDMIMYDWQYELCVGGSNYLKWYTWSTRWRDYAKVNPDVPSHGYWDNTTDPFGWSWKNDGIVFPDYNIVSTLDCGCIDPRKHDSFRPEIKSLYCSHDKEYLLDLKRKAGYEIFD